MRDRITIYHDGSCPLCRAEIAHYRRQAGADRLAFVDASASGDDLGADLSAGQAMRRFHVRLPDGTLRSGASAFVAVWSTLPRWRWAAGVAAIPGVLPVLELGYRLSLRLRPALARGLIATRTVR